MTPMTLTMIVVPVVGLVMAIGTVMASRRDARRFDQDRRP